ncbi:MAG: hypothetical protein ABSH35_13005 [Isosphaeraceae bacterium]|jgi:hypothetical protein
MSLPPYLGRKRPRGHAHTWIRAPRVEPAPEPESELPPTPEPMIDPQDPRYVRFADLVILPSAIPKGTNRAR